ncbi:MAG: trypsin-like peptidase domain-containing protein [Polyangiaceae bacterium]|nr:trypsin-like peptidase domain-containing protein [Polyangiaceae bacterium]
MGKCGFALASFLVVGLVIGNAACKDKGTPRSDALPPNALAVIGSAYAARASDANDANEKSGAVQPKAAGEIAGGFGTQENPGPLKMAPVSFAPIAKRADPSVVTVYTVGDDDGRLLFSRRGKSRAQKGVGTGFVVAKDGVVLTNNHVIDGADEIVVQLSDERRFSAKIAGRDARTDIALVKIDGANDLVTLPLGDSDALEVGDWVVAIGNPFGLSHTVSAGIVSAKGRGRDEVPLDPTGYYNFLQTDASINPGNSGGPLLNMRAEVVGMNTAIRAGGAQGIGFAIPINMVKQLMPTLLKEGHITRSALGVRIRDVRDLLDVEKQQLKVSGDRGAVIEYVEPGGSAEKAKLEIGDVIVAFDGKAVERGTLLQWLASTAGVGKSVNVRIVRAGTPFDIKVTLGELKEPKAKAPALRKPPPASSDPDEDDDFAR